MLVSLLQTVEPVGRYTTVCDAKPDLRLPSQSQSTAIAHWLVLISSPAEDRRLSWPE